MAAVTPLKLLLLLILEYIFFSCEFAVANYNGNRKMYCRYNYTRDDEEIYKEVMEIANELIPHIMKVVTGHNVRSILKDPECFAYSLRFYDGICQWEEGSQTPVLHIGWAKPLVNTISKFDAEVRSQVAIIEHDFPNGDENCNSVQSKIEEGPRKENGKSFFDLNSCMKNDAESNNLHPGIRELTAARGEKLLNRDFLLQGGGEPFIGDSEVLNVCPSIDNDNIFESILSESQPPRIILSSEKMKGLKNLLLGEKLNTQAISLQLTAQSQVQVGSKKSNLRDVTDAGINVRSKRSRRE